MQELLNRSLLFWQGINLQCAQHVVLLHLSRQCNEPSRITELYAACAPHLLERLVITGQNAPSRKVRVEVEVKRNPGDSVLDAPEDLERTIGKSLKETG